MTGSSPMRDVLDCAACLTFGRFVAEAGIAHTTVTKVTRAYESVRSFSTLSTGCQRLACITGTLCRSFVRIDRLCREHRVRSRSEQAAAGVRIGLFGLLGSGNIGNDASMEAVLKYLQERHPLAVIDVMCSGPERVTAEYGLDAVQMFWFDRH